MPRLRTRWVWIGVALVAVIAIILAALPEVVRRIAVGQIRTAASREAVIGDIDLNLFTGTLVVKSFRLADRVGSEPFVEFDRLTARLRLLPLFTGQVRIAEIHLEAPTVRLMRTAPGAFNFSDLLEPGESKKAARGGIGFTLERFRLDRGSIIAHDRAITPAQSWKSEELFVEVRDLTLRSATPAGAPAPFEIKAGLPGGGRLEARGALSLSPLGADLRLAITGVDLAQFRPYSPIPARLEGKADADVAIVTTLTPALTATVRGKASVSRLSVGTGGRPAIEVERTEITEIDVSWPTRVAVGRVRIEKPRAMIERNERGELPLRAAMTPRQSAPSPPLRADTGAGAAAEPKQLAIEIGEVALVDGYARFTDRTVSPAFSEELSRLSASLKGLSNAPGKRAQLLVQGVLGGNSALSLRGEVAPLGDTLYVDLDGELREFTIPRANNFLDPVLAWIARDGRLSTKAHYRIEGDRLSATNEIVIGRLELAQAGERDEVKQRLGLPLGLIVALLKDARGEIRVTIPVSGSLGAPEFSFGEAIWTAVKNVVVNILTAPFKLIGGLFSKDDKIDALNVDPVRFEAGSAAVRPEMSQHLQQVGDFLKGSPFVTLALAPVVTAADLTSLKTQEITARIQRLQREERIAEFPEAATRLFKAELPDREVPKSVEEIITALRDRLPEPEASARTLAERRVQAVREALVATAAVPTDRLPDSTAVPSDSSGDGRVEFSLTQ